MVTVYLDKKLKLSFSAKAFLSSSPTFSNCYMNTDNQTKLA